MQVMSAAALAGTSAAVCKSLNELNFAPKTAIGVGRVTTIILFLLASVLISAFSQLGYDWLLDIILVFQLGVCMCLCVSIGQGDI